MYYVLLMSDDYNNFQHCKHNHKPAETITYLFYCAIFIETQNQLINTSLIKNPFYFITLTTVSRLSVLQLYNLRHVQVNLWLSAGMYVFMPVKHMITFSKLVCMWRIKRFDLDLNTRVCV